MKNILLLISISSILIFTSCDKVDNPIPQDTTSTDGIDWDDSLYVESNPSIRKILIEEFTGHLCTYCPDGAREIDNLVALYGSQIIPLSYHAGNFADVPASGNGFDANGDGVMDYTTNFKTISGEIYFSTFGVASNPAATVSRINNAGITGLSQWDADILSIKNDVPKVSIGLSTLYDDSTRIVKAVVNTEWLSSETGNYKLQLYLVQDSIYDWQLDNSVHMPLYLHRHVFRKAINGAWGTPIPSSNIGDINTQEHAIELNPEWDKDHCIVIAHIYTEGPNYEVLQAEELHITSH